MRSVLTILVLMLSTLAGAQGSDLRMTVKPPRFTCEGHAGNSLRVAFHPDAAAADFADGRAPLPCCNGQIGCAQFLSTNTIIRTRHGWRG
jgi:hypothetical protein